MPDKTICHGIDGRLYRELERRAAEAGITPDEYAARLVRESIVERTKPKGAGKVRFLGRD